MTQLLLHFLQMKWLNENEIQQSASQTVCLAVSSKIVVKWNLKDIWWISYWIHFTVQSEMMRNSPSASCLAGRCTVQDPGWSARWRRCLGVVGSTKRKVGCAVSGPSTYASIMWILQERMAVEVAWVSGCRRRIWWPPGRRLGTVFLRLVTPTAPLRTTWDLVTRLRILFHLDVGMLAMFTRRRLSRSKALYEWPREPSKRKCRWNSFQRWCRSTCDKSRNRLSWPRCYPLAEHCNSSFLLKDQYAFLK